MGGGIGQGAATLFYDTFTDTDGTLLDAHTPDIDTVGGGWTNAHGSWDIQGNKAQKCTAGSAPQAAIAVVDVGQADCVLTATFTLATEDSYGYGGFTARFTDKDNLFFISISASEDRFALARRQGGVWTTLDYVSVPISAGVEYTIRCTLAGNDITAVLNGTYTVSATDSMNNTSTVHGLFCGNAAHTADNFRVMA